MNKRRDDFIATLQLILLALMIYFDIADNFNAILALCVPSLACIIYWFVT